MSQRLMLLPALMTEQSILVTIPDDFADEEAYRHVTGLIAQVEEARPNSYTRDDVMELLEDHGFTEVAFVAGPELD